MIYLDAEQQCSEHSLIADENNQSRAGISASHSAQQLSCGGQIAQDRRDKINYQYLMMAIPQSEEKKRFSLGQRSNSGLTMEQDSFLQDSWSTEKSTHQTAPQRQMSSVTIDPGDLATDSKSLRRGSSHDYQNVSFDGDEDALNFRFSHSTDPTSQSPDSKLQSTDPFLCDSWAGHDDNTMTTSNTSSKAVTLPTSNDQSTGQLEYEHVWNDDDDEEDDDNCDVAVAPLQIDFGDLIDAIDNSKQQQAIDNSKQQQQRRKQHSTSNTQDVNDDDYHDYHKGPIKVQSQPIQRSNSIILSSGSHADPVSGDPDYQNYGSEDYANVFDTPSTPANQKSTSGYDMLQLKPLPPKSNTLSGHSFSITGSHDQTNESHEQEAPKLVESGNNPFAGLVITASSITNHQDCHGDLTRSMARSVIRRSNASYLDDENRQSFWGSDRVEQEFDQVSFFKDDVTINYHNLID